MEIIIIELKGDNRKVSVKIRKLEGTITFRGSSREETDTKKVNVHIDYTAHAWCRCYISSRGARVPRTRVNAKRISMP